MMLEHLGLTSFSVHIRKAIDKVLEEKLVFTKDLRGKSGTQEMTQAIINAIQ